MDNKIKLTHLFSLQLLCALKIVLVYFYWDTLLLAFICSTREEAMQYYKGAESYLPLIFLSSTVLWVDVISGHKKAKEGKKFHWYKIEIQLLLIIDILFILSIGHDKYLPTVLGLIFAYILAAVLLFTLYMKVKQTKRDHNKRAHSDFNLAALDRNQ